MYHIYMVMIQLGFRGAKYFHHYENAKRFADSIGEIVETESVTAQELFSMEFEDINKYFVETPNVQFNIL